MYVYVCPPPPHFVAPSYATVRDLLTHIKQYIIRLTNIDG